MDSLIPSKFTGIIQLVPADASELLALQEVVLRQYPDQKPNPKLHVTLLHQSFPKKVLSDQGIRGDKALKNLYKNGGQMGIPTPNLQLGDVRIGEDLSTGRISSYVVIENFAECIEVRNMILEAASINPEILDTILTPEESSREFHISLTNLEGTSGASIAYPNKNDIRLEVR